MLRILSGADLKDDLFHDSIHHATKHIKMLSHRIGIPIVKKKTV